MTEIWPSNAGSGTAEKFENATIKEQWMEEAKRLFCEKEEDMLVESGTISSRSGEWYLLGG
jgi:hypothetical protein